MKKLILFLGLVLMAGRMLAQKPAIQNSADIILGLQKLKVLGSVLYVAAHPDDENTRLLAYLSRERKYRTGYLSLTRGDGGQNLIGDEQGVSLGLIRTQELLAARRIDGAEQFFSRAFDFGFSKSTEEALKLWNHQKVLSDVVWVIRKFKPDVIITRFPPDARAGHGQHSASAALAIEAFTAAADPKQFPEQLKFVQPWQAKRILWNTYNFGTINTQLENQYKIDVGVFNPLLGKSYGELAGESRSQHKSQGFGVPLQRGSAFEYFSETAGEPIGQDLLSGINTTWGRVGADEIGRLIDSIMAVFKPTEPSAIIPALLALRDKISFTDNDFWRDKKLDEIEKLIPAAMGLYFEAVANQQVAVTGDSLQVTFNLVNRSSIPLKNVKVNYRDTVIQLTGETQLNKAYSATSQHLVKDNFLADQPYWLREQMDTGSFNVNAQPLIGLPQNPQDHVILTYGIEDKILSATYPLQYKFTDPVKGEIYQPVFTVPPIVVGALPTVILNNLQPRHPQEIQLTYKSYVQRDTAKARLRFELQKTATGSKEKLISLQLARPKNLMQTIAVPFDSLIAKEKPQQIYPWIDIQEGGKSVSYNNAMKLIQYDHIPTVHYFFPNSIKVVNEEIKVLGKLIGYIPGSGDAVPEALKQMGFTVEILDDAALSANNLARYDAIIAGVRAYNVKESLNNYYEKLMAYIANGGNLIVQYNTSSQIGPVKALIGPYPFTITRTRVTDEKAAVSIEQPNHPVLNFPNKIGSRDFEGWIQERSIYHASNWDKRYETIFSMHDPGESPDSGSLIMTRYGKGYFVYTGLVFFRELPAGVPGAYRLLANLIALNQKKGF
jgi:LmbE family N-acetylglucosaminyl deacetylase